MEIKNRTIKIIIRNSSESNNFVLRNDFEESMRYAKLPSTEVNAVGPAGRNTLWHIVFSSKQYVEKYAAQKYIKVAGNEATVLLCNSQKN